MGEATVPTMTGTRINFLGDYKKGVIRGYPVE
jgi:hypothetical protein